MPALEKLNIDTPEQVALEFSLATVGSRFLALAVDSVIQLACGVALFAVVALGAWVSSVTIAGARPWVLAIFVLGLFVINFAYFAVFESLWNGQTPGKRLIGLRVIHASGRPISVFEAILRNVVRIADQLPGIYAIGIVSVFLTERSQRLGDLAAGTVVVHERLVKAEAADFGGAAPPALALTHHGASRLTAEEIAVIELFFRRREELDGYGRLRAARQVAARVRERLGITAKIDDEQLLEEVIAEHRARGRFR
ncbi:MAG TPA: RDD family protein [Vicinamibacterales bacterium]|nr:RDD family protein [Vicinamibacterales bacterium]